jgi:hypothetical protein
MSPRIEDQFETLESPYDFVTLLAETVAEAKQELESDVQRESASNLSRRLDALRMAYTEIEVFYSSRKGRTRVSVSA